MAWQDKLSPSTAALFARIADAARRALPNSGLPEGVDRIELNTALIEVAAAKGLLEIVDRTDTDAEMRTTPAGRALAPLFIRFSSGDVLGWPALVRAIDQAAEGAVPPAPPTGPPPEMVAQIWSRVVLYEGYRKSGYERSVVATPEGQVPGVVWFPAAEPPNLAGMNLSAAFEAGPPGGPVLFVAWPLLYAGVVAAAQDCGLLLAHGSTLRAAAGGQELWRLLASIQQGAPPDIDGLLAAVTRLCGLASAASPTLAS